MFVTSLCAALLAFLFIGLSVGVIKQRRSGGVGMGDGDDFALIRRMRAQGNFAEYTPFFLLLLFLAESNGLAGYLLYGISGMFILGRVAHAYSLLKAERYEYGKLLNKPKWRVVGMVCTFACIGMLAVSIVGLQFYQPDAHY